MLWIETQTKDEAKEIQERLWAIDAREMRGHTEYRVNGQGLCEKGEFWADAIRKLINDPEERLKMAKRHLPAPAAFREAALALRAIIRECRKQKTDFSAALTDLYRLAAIWSFYIDYAPRLKQPGYNVLARVPFKEFEAMSLEWETLGWEKLDLLTKTDRNWMREAWGEAPTHTTAYDKYRDVWERYENILITEESDRNSKFGRTLRSLGKKEKGK